MEKVKSAPTYTLRFIRINPDFDQQHADEMHRGKESEDNIKYLWEDELELSEVSNLAIKNRSTYLLQGSDGETTFEYELPDMCVIEAKLKTGEINHFGVSQKILKNSNHSEKEGNHTYSFYIKGRFEPINPFLGLYVLAKDFPEELLNQEIEE